MTVLKTKTEPSLILETHYNTPLGKGTATKYVLEVQNILKEVQGR